jgi:hypothetical protein
MSEIREPEKVVKASMSEIREPEGKGEEKSVRPLKRKKRDDMWLPRPIRRGRKKKGKGVGKYDIRFYEMKREYPDRGEYDSYIGWMWIWEDPDEVAMMKIMEWKREGMAYWKEDNMKDTKPDDWTFKILEDRRIEVVEETTGLQLYRGWSFEHELQSLWVKLIEVYEPSLNRKEDMVVKWTYDDLVDFEVMDPLKCLSSVNKV